MMVLPSGAFNNHCARSQENYAVKTVFKLKAACKTVLGCVLPGADLLSVFYACLTLISVLHVSVISATPSKRNIHLSVSFIFRMLYCVHQR